MKKQENSQMSEPRELLLKNARARFREFERTLNVQDGIKTRNFLMYAAAGFGELDPSGESSESTIEAEFNDLMKQAHLKAASEALDELFSLGDTKKVDAVFFHLRKADSTLERLAEERGTSQQQLIGKMAEVVVSARRIPHPIFSRTRVKTLDK